MSTKQAGERGGLETAASHPVSVSNCVAVRVPAVLTRTVQRSSSRCSPAPSVAQLPETWQWVPPDTTVNTKKVRFFCNSMGVGIMRQVSQQCMVSDDAAWPTVGSTAGVGGRFWWRRPYIWV